MGLKVDLIRVVGGCRGGHSRQDGHILLGNGKVVDLGILPDARRGHGFGQGDDIPLEAPADADLGHGLAVLGGQLCQEGVVQQSAAAQGAPCFYQNVVGLAVIYYFAFRFIITKFNLKTPGREDDDVEAEKKVTLSNDNFTEVAAIILEGVGGKENVASIDNCVTRLRLEVKDQAKVDEKKIKSAGVAGVIRPGKTSVQVIIGTQVQFVADEFKKLCK